MKILQETFGMNGISDLALAQACSLDLTLQVSNCSLKPLQSVAVLVSALVCICSFS
jgi:hypothetical protein